MAARGLEGFRPARVGKDSRAEPQTRTDELRWFDPTESPPQLVPVVDALDRLRRELNAGAYLGLDRLELQLARYLAPGSGYARHRDSFPGRLGRRVTAIYYLNEAWLPEHAGALRLHLQPEPVDVVPLLDTLVVFLSEDVEHEVLPTRAPRWALTAWWSGRGA